MYPVEAVRWLLGEQSLRILDLGAGTGKLTRTLVELGHDVVAVEPSAEMLGQLRRVLPAVEALAGSAEEIPLPRECVDAVAAGQAFHWFDPERALPEIARVLRPEGRLAAVWNMFDEEQAFVTRLYEVLPPSGREGGPVDSLAESELFGPVEKKTFSFGRRLGRGEFVECIGTSSAVATLPDAERAATLAAVGRLHDDEAAAGTVVLPYVTIAYRTRRL